MSEVTERPAETRIVARSQPREQAQQWLSTLEAALAAGDVERASALFAKTSFWSDLAALTWNITTLEGPEAISGMLAAQLPNAAPRAFTVTGDATEDAGVTEAWFTCETRDERRPLGAEHGSVSGRKSWLETREQELSELGYKTQPYVLIVGGGQGGIALGARLRQHGVPPLIIEKNARPGDSWRNRYKSLCLPDPVWYDHLPNLPFPPNSPVF